MQTHYLCDVSINRSYHWKHEEFHRTIILRESSDFHNSWSPQFNIIRLFSSIHSSTLCCWSISKICNRRISLYSISSFEPTHRSNNRFTSGNSFWKMFPIQFRYIILIIIMWFFSNFQDICKCMARMENSWNGSLCTQLGTWS